MKIGSTTIRVEDRGFTLVELLIASSILLLVSAAVLAGSVSVQRSFRASQAYVISQASQSRLLDYIGVDLRRATAVEVPNVPKPERIDLWIPDFYKADGTPKDPSFIRNSSGRLSVQYGGAPLHIAYYIERPAGSSQGTLWRDEDGVKTAIATEVRDFSPVFLRSGDAEDSSEQVFKLSVTFVPKFQWSGDGSSARDGTAASTRILLRNKRPR